jgi:hypothetical protein
MKIHYMKLIIIDGEDGSEPLIETTRVSKKKWEEM